MNSSTDTIERPGADASASTAAPVAAAQSRLVGVAAALWRSVRQAPAYY